jgi:hypothetical protein
MIRESFKTGAFVAAAVALAVVAGVVEPETATPGIMSDQGQAFYPDFKDPQAVKIIEVVDYDEPTATARPFQVAFERGRWILASSHNYPLDAGERLVKTAAALMDLKKDQVSTDSPLDHARYGVVDPLDQKVAGLQGRGKRVTLRGAHKDMLADFILGKPVDGKQGWRYVRVPGQKRVYAVKTDADPSAKFADWVNAGFLRIPTSTIRRVSVTSYSINESMGRLDNLDSVKLTHEGGEWKLEGGEKVNKASVAAMASALDNLKIADVRPKPTTLARDLRSGQLQLSLESAMSLRQKGFFITPTGRLLANEGEMTVETAGGVNYSLRFGELSGSGDSRYLFVMASGKAPESEARVRELNNRFADWYYIISGADFQKLRLKRKDVAR